MTMARPFSPTSVRIPRTGPRCGCARATCREDVCVPIPKAMTRGGYFNLTAFASKVGEPVVADVDERVWSFGEIQLLKMGSLNSRVAPDFSVPDRRGRPVHLSDFRGKKVLLVTWASW